MRTSRSFPPVTASTTAARQFVLQAAGAAPADVLDAIAVMAAELVMNAVQHARTEFEVTVERTGSALRVEVADSGDGSPVAEPMPPPRSPRGRGLPIVDSLADAWGIIPSARGQGKSVWFQIDLPAPVRSTAQRPAGASRSAWDGEHNRRHVGRTGVLGANDLMAVVGAAVFARLAVP